MSRGRSPTLHVSWSRRIALTERLQKAPRRSEFEKVRANYARKVMVEGKGFVDCVLNPDATLARTKWQIVAFRGLACPFHAPGAERFGV